MINELTDIVYFSQYHKFYYYKFSYYFYIKTNKNV